MDFSKISFEEFESAIGKTSEKDLRAMLAEHGVSLPPHRMSREVLLRAAHEALRTGSKKPAGAAAPAPMPAVPPTSPAASAGDSAPPVPPEPAGARFRIRSIPGPAVHEQKGHWRCGRHWPPTRGAEVFENEFTPDEWERLRADSRLEIVEVA